MGSDGYYGPSSLGRLQNCFLLPTPRKADKLSCHRVYGLEVWNVLLLGAKEAHQVLSFLL